MTAISTEQARTAQPPMRLGILLFIFSEIFLFGSLFATYYSLRAFTPGWPPEHPEITLAAINTFLLLSSSATIWWASSSIQKGKEKGLALGLALTLLLGAAFLGITVFEWTHEAFRPWTNAYGSIFFTLTSALLTRTLRHRFSASHFLGVEIGSYYWHFVDFIWIIVFTTLFLVR